MRARLSGLSEIEKKERRREYQRQWAANKRAKEAAGNKILNFPPSKSPEQKPKKKNPGTKGCTHLPSLVSAVDSLTASLKESEKSRQSEMTKLQSTISQLEHERLLTEKRHMEAVDSLKNDLANLKRKPSLWSFQTPSTPDSVVFLPPKSVQPSDTEPVNKHNRQGCMSSTYGGWASYLFVLTCVAIFTGLTVYLQHQVYMTRGYSEHLSWAFALVGELSLLTTAYFLRYSTGARNLYLKGTLLIGGIIVAATVGNGAFEKIRKHQEQRQLAEADYARQVKLTEQENTRLEQRWNDTLNRLKQDQEDIKATRDLYTGSSYSKKDRQEQDKKLDAARAAISKHELTNPVVKPFPEKPIIEAPNTFSLILQIGFQLFVFAISLGLAGLMPTFLRRGKEPAY